jgi:protein-S-isoprenylcysteine O-methyltransferase Ste14
MSPGQHPQVTPKTFFGSTKIIHLAFLGGQVMFAGLIFIKNGSTIILTDTSDPLLIVAPAMAIGCFIASMFLYKQRVAAAADGTSLLSKLTLYQTAFIIRCALLEGASLFNVGCYLLTGNFLFLLIAIVIILYFITLRPTIDKATEELNLTYEEKLEIEN